MSLPLFASIRSYWVLPSITSSLCWSMILFLSRFGNHIACRTTISPAMHDPSSMLILQMQGLQCLGRHLWAIQVTVDHGSKSALSKVRDHISEMVSHTTMMLRVVSLYILGSVAMMSFRLLLASLLASRTGKASLMGRVKSSASPWTDEKNRDDGDLDGDPYLVHFCRAFVSKCNSIAWRGEMLFLLFINAILLCDEKR